MACCPGHSQGCLPASLPAAKRGAVAPIRHRAPASEVRHLALDAGMRTLRQDGIEKVLQGLTDMGQVTAATNL